MIGSDSTRPEVTRSLTARVRAPLAVIAGLFSLIPLVGATIAAVLIGIVTLFENFPTATIVWAIWAIVYQQFENHVIQPQIQKRTVHVHPFVTIVSVLFGATLLGVLGALVASSTTESNLEVRCKGRACGRTSRFPVPSRPDPSLGHGQSASTLGAGHLPGR